MNLVGPSALAAFWLRHAYDSAQLLFLAPEALTWADLGAGAGFPGIVLAIKLKGREGAHVHLVESMAKRCRFLSEVVAALDLPATVHNVRAESLEIKVDAVTARALRLPWSDFWVMLGHTCAAAPRGSSSKDKMLRLSSKKPQNIGSFTRASSPALAMPRAVLFS